MVWKKPNPKIDLDYKMLKNMKATLWYHNTDISSITSFSQICYKYGIVLSLLIVLCILNQCG